MELTSDEVLTNCTFTNNTAEYYGGALYVSGFGFPTIANSAFCGNTPEHIYGSYADGGGNNFKDFCAGECSSDIDGNGSVDVLDLLGVIEAWGSCDDPSGCPADINDDGTTDVLDLLVVIANWGTCP